MTERKHVEAKIYRWGFAGIGKKCLIARPDTEDGHFL
jgi:hypothetical protein